MVCSKVEDGCTTLVIGELVYCCVAVWSNTHLSVVVCRPEQHILLFRRPLGTDPVTGQVSAQLQREAREEYQRHLQTHMRK